MKKIAQNLALMLALAAPALSHATVITFQTLPGAGYQQDSVVDGNLWKFAGIVFSIPQGLVTACGGNCLSAAANNYYGEVDRKFVLPGAGSAATVTNFGIGTVTGSSITKLFDVSGTLLGSYNGELHLCWYEGCRQLLDVRKLRWYI